MDVLSSLNIAALPEQETRMMHLLKDYPNFELRLGFDACCNCGKSIDATNEFICLACQRVKYCSDECRQKDATAELFENRNASEGIEGEDDNETAQGHTSIVCTMLQTCNDDEDVEDCQAFDISESRRQASLDRIRSEYESYPASLANIIVEGPCFQSVLNECTSTLVIHVVGASEEAELGSWKRENQTTSSRFQDYAEAFSNVAVSYRTIQSIIVCFIGPECPTSNADVDLKLLDSEKQQKSLILTIRTVRGFYSAELLDDNAIPTPNIVVFFNPGFTVPEYDRWATTLKCIPKGTPFMSTTNTEMEGIADCQFLLDQDRIQTIPPALADMFGIYSSPDKESCDDEDVETTNAIFSENPFCGSRVRQSGTMGNDLFVKNRWMLLGILDSFEASPTKKESSSKKAKTASSCNYKSSNPALI